MASGTTNIDDLPTNDKPNVTLETIDAPVQNTSGVTANNPQPQMAQLSQEDINKIVTGIQTASQNNLTSLPSRDIPMNTNNVVTDNQVQPNFVPETKNHEDYINQHDTAQSLYEKQLEKERNKIKNDELYDKLQTPILIAILFFLFQLPVVNNAFYKYLPNLFIGDGTMSFSGYLFKSSLFGALYFIIIKAIDYLSDI